ncbi:LOW QUALITY PROTEIN: hypothetical protein Cgig2_003470 [Carnegiea gigantea]|uniref:Uncharacterized protein n=1 Tax=Carnegiea gigantea TaxID=171969 RepID=A0A9Q1QH15_9CARY|nr:LOW QUALITY PROTEIN: hypothetical protein Cgig2_003470 [Carnegiea gigantea]
MSRLRGISTTEKLGGLFDCSAVALLELWASGSTSSWTLQSDNLECGVKFITAGRQSMHTIMPCSGRPTKLTPSWFVGAVTLHCMKNVWRSQVTKKGLYPMRYLGVTITASKLSKLEYRTLVEKIQRKIRQWYTRSFSFAGRAQLINSVIFGMYSFWASIFILPQEVIDQELPWGGGDADFKIPPFISTSIYFMDHNLYSQKIWGDRTKEFGCLEQGQHCKISVVYCIEKRHVMGQMDSWQIFKVEGKVGLSSPTRLQLKKVVANKEQFKQGVTQGATWAWQGRLTYTVQSGYKWLLGGQVYKDWSRQSIQNWWHSSVDISNKESFVKSLVKIKGSRGEKQITCAIAAAVIYYIWRTRNEKIFSNHQIHVQTQFKLTTEHIIQRIFTLNRFSRKYQNCIEKVIG